jgi:hypothetical protein
MTAGVNYAVSFRITNPLIYKRRPVVNISLAGGILWKPTNMTYATGCAEPFYLDIGAPAFKTACMNQSVPYPGVNNTLTILWL